jgi:ADP-heptose:LPS heptosyltransferase
LKSIGHGWSRSTQAYFIVRGRKIRSVEEHRDCMRRWPVLRPLIKGTYLRLRKAALTALVRKAQNPNCPHPLTSLVVVSESRLGDICLEIPVLRKFRLNYPHTFFAIVAPRDLQPLIRLSCQPDLLLDFGESAHLRNRAWDVAIDLTRDYHLKPARITASTCAPIRMGFEYGGRGRYFSRSLALPEAEHSSRTYTRPFKLIGMEEGTADLNDFSLSLPDIGDKYAVGIHPGAHHRTQRWPPNYFAQLIRLLHSAGHTCVVFGAGTEQRLAGGIVERSGKVARLLITNDPIRLASAIRNVDVLVCNNSGPLHLAGLVGTPTLSFMGPTVKEKWWPLAGNAVVLRRDQLPCIGCNLGYCKIRTHACMMEITPAAAFAEYNRFKSEGFRRIGT